MDQIGKLGLCIDLFLSVWFISIERGIITVREVDRGELVITTYRVESFAVKRHVPIAHCLVQTIEPAWITPY